MPGQLSAADVERPAALLRAGARQADVQSATALVADVRANLRSSGLDEVADTLDRLHDALLRGAEGAEIGGHMNTVGGQLEALATREPGTGRELRELAELLKSEGSKLARGD